MSDEMTFTLHNPLTEEEWDMITDVDLDHTSEITFHTKHGKEVVFVKRKLPPAQPEPCKDAVSREEVSSWLKQYGQDVLHGKYKFSLMYIWKNLMNLPSVQPATNCSEFPNTSDFVSRKAVREMVSTWAYDLMEQEDLNMALHDVDELPPVSVERKGGKKNEGNF